MGDPSQLEQQKIDPSRPGSKIFDLNPSLLSTEQTLQNHFDFLRRIGMVDNKNIWKKITGQLRIESQLFC